MNKAISLAILTRPLWTGRWFATLCPQYLYWLFQGPSVVPQPHGLYLLKVICQAKASPPESSVLCQHPSIPIPKEFRPSYRDRHRTLSSEGLNPGKQASAASRVSWMTESWNGPGWKGQCSERAPRGYSWGKKLLELNIVTTQVFSTTWPEKMGLAAEEAVSKIINRVAMKDINEKYQEMIRGVCLLGRGQRMSSA